MRKIKRHGDIILYPIEKIEGKEVKHNGKFVLALGEATGHTHTLMCQSMQIFAGKRNNISLEEEGQLIHQQHKPINLVAQKYAQVQEREVDHFSGAVRKVVD